MKRADANLKNSASLKDEKIVCESSAENTIFEELIGHNRFGDLTQVPSNIKTDNIEVIGKIIFPIDALVDEY